MTRNPFDDPGPDAPRDPDETVSGDDLIHDSPTAEALPRRAEEGPAGSDAPPPDRIGPYPILQELGRGGMGIVYLAQDPRLERTIAIKLLPRSLGKDPAAFSRFRNEAKMLAAINNPNIATIYSLESEADAPFLTMERILGRSLAERLHEGAADLDVALAVARQIAGALEAAHRNGIVHLDLKPGNVMVTDDGLVKVLDFGLAMALGIDSSDPDEIRTRAQAQEAIGGSPGYMSPEQIRGEAVDSRADLWAFGCILFELLSGVSPFPGRDWRARLRRTLEEDPDFDLLPAELPPRIRTLVRGCLTRDVAERIDSVTKIRRGIEEEIALRAVPRAEVPPEPERTNLPIPISAFIGRAEERAEVRRLLESSRFLTLTGVGGGGKTRLAVEVGRERIGQHPDGVWLVELAALGSPELVPAAVAQALGVKEEANRAPAEVLLEHCRARRLLLILDNCEHLVGAVADLAGRLLAACPGLQILATSREPIGIEGEVQLVLSSMRLPRPGVPATPEALDGIESVALFLARAKAAASSFALTSGNAESIAQICRRLDGIPLALELAAARVRSLPPEEIARRLDDRFRLLGSSRKPTLPHHQTLRALIDWSYDHLEEAEQVLFRRLALFAGGWSLEAAETICAGEGIEAWELLDLLSNLVDKSLVESDREGGLE
ncbi:MAG: protein kinase, partial [Candidatus Eisenbacteria bacterium]|nr:protein kinase [Candidatus Latescibacterota bacterium]MBD3301442.1 protein kinase [Candidatus Eisenbacteria bacterium]